MAQKQTYRTMEPNRKPRIALTCMQVRKQQIELDTEQQTGSK